jgi:hypothetical protein
MIELYLDPDFTVEGNDFVFKAHDDDNINYVVKISIDDLCAYVDISSERVNISTIKIFLSKGTIYESCQQIVDRYQTGTTSYDVEIEPKKVEKLEDAEYKCKGRKYKVLKQLSPYFGQTMKEVSILSIQGITKGVCFEVLHGGEWDEVSFLFSELEEQK